jgi:hypothetical protein
VDPVPEAASISFVKGSHDGTWYMPKTFLTEQANRHGWTVKSFMHRPVYFLSGFV